MKKESRAVALIYPEPAPPRVIAKGDNNLAERILAEAQKHNVPVKEEPALVEVLSEINLGEEIPPELYVAVAEVLSFAFALQQKVPASWVDD